jgi:nucleotide-binding universal stress UspA family protein
MDSFARLLVPVDFSEVTPKVLAIARDLLAPAGRLTLLHVVETLPTVMEGAYGVYAHRRDIEEMKRLTLEKLQQQTHDADDGRVEALVREGKPADEIVAAAGELRTDVIVIGSHGRSRLEHLLVGSVTERVLRRAPCHVFVVRA